MGLPIVLLKSLAAASANNIAASQAVTGGNAMLLNGSASNYLSTTSTAATAAGGTVLTLASTTGLVAGQLVSDTTNNSIPSGVAIAAVGSSTVTLNRPVGGASGVANGDTIVFPGTAIIDAATSTNIAIGRRVVLAYSGTDTTFKISGTNSTGNQIADTVVGSGGAAQSNLDFVTVTSIVPVGSITGATAGTNGVGSSPWVGVNWHDTPSNVSYGCVVTGTINYTVQYTYDDPNNLPAGVSFPQPFNHPTLLNLAASNDGFSNDPIIAWRVLINSGTGTIRVTGLQAGISGS